MPPRRPLIQDLLVPKLLHTFADEQYDHAEVVTRLALSNLPNFDKAVDELNLMRTVAAMLRTATLFVVDHDEAQQAIATAGDCPMDEFPPLPYPRIAFECSEDVGWQVYLNTTAPTEAAARLDIEQRVANGEDPAYIIDLVMVNEAQQGREWHVIHLTRIPDTDMPTGDVRQAVCLRLTSDGGVQVAKATQGDEDPTQTWEDPPPGLAAPSLLTRTPVELAHLVNARGVSLVDISSRADRRRAARRGFVFPSVYWVDLRSSFETNRGASDREYHCRWLVRGHWRHLDETRRTWVRPYIKGPTGAPWKGRPVYRVNAAA